MLYFLTLRFADVSCVIIRGLHDVHPVRIARFHVTRLLPRVGLPRNLLLIGNLTAALRLSKGWVRKDPNLGLRTGCMMFSDKLNVMHV